MALLIPIRNATISLKQNGTSVDVFCVFVCVDYILLAAEKYTEDSCAAPLFYVF